MQCINMALLVFLVGLWAVFSKKQDSVATPAETLPTKCSLPPQYGNCNYTELRYYYDVKVKMCRLFIYSGCGGNANKFYLLRPCLEACKKFGVPASWQSTTGLPAKCKEKVKNGNCLAIMKRYYYDQRLKMCRDYEYGGCGASNNHFETYKECYEECQRFGPPEFLVNPEVLDEFVLSTCEQPPNTGTCDKNFLRYYYDPQAKECKLFEYTGCNGNENNFRNKDECIEICLKNPWRPNRRYFR